METPSICVWERGGGGERERGCDGHRQERVLKKGKGYFGKAQTRPWEDR